jgi:hypothetical protein
MAMTLIRLLFVTGILNASAVDAQTITITSGSTKQPLPFATIQNLRAQWASVSSDKGTFSFSAANSNAGDSILISYTGYLPIRMLKPAMDITLAMEPSPVALAPVVVSPCKGTRTGELHNFKKNKSDLSLGSDEGALATWAAYIPNPDKVKGILTSIQFWLNNTDMPKSATGAPFKVRLLQYDDSTGFPGEPFLLKELIVYPEGKKVEIDVSEERLRLDENGLVVAIDFFYAGEQYVHTHKVKDLLSDGSSVDTIMTNYGSSIEAVRGDNMVGKGYIFRYKSNKWGETRNSTSSQLAPKIELNLKLCD